jgi:hypothetical protein
MLSLKSYYITTYKDLFFMDTLGNAHFEPPFLKMFIWSELVFQAPTMIWGVYGLWSGLFPRLYSFFSLPLDFDFDFDE